MSLSELKEWAATCKANLEADPYDFDLYDQRQAEEKLGDILKLIESLGICMNALKKYEHFRGGAMGNDALVKIREIWVE